MITEDKARNLALLRVPEGIAILPKSELAPRILPVRLIIPSINVDSTLDYVGVSPSGDVAVPKTPVDAGWFDRGPSPGESGSAIVVGHYGWKDGVSAVFDHLDRLVKGDKVYIEDEKGVTTAFVVREVQKYDLVEDTTKVFGPGDGKSHLNLITCGGVWDKAENSYSYRLVVFTDKE